MEHKNIEPHKVTKPIQLLAAWLAGLVLVNGTFLGAAMTFEAGSIERTILTIAAIINVPLFLGAIFLLQTKFRPELQEDSYYSSYLDKKTQKLTEVNPLDDIRAYLNSIQNEISLLKAKTEQVDAADEDFKDISIHLSEKLSEVDNIKLKLRDLNVSSILMFDPESEGSKPERFHVVLNPDLPFDFKIKLLKTASEYNFDSYSYDRPDAVNTSDVYIGGYGYSGDYYQIDKVFSNVINDNPTRHDLRDYEIEHEHEDS